MAAGGRALRHRPVGLTTRRAVFAGIAAALAPRPLPAQEQSRDGMHRLGVLMGVSDDPLGQTRAAALVQGLSALNWHDGGNLRIDWRWAGGDPALYERYAAELIALDPEVLVAWASPSVAALRRRTSTIPIVIVNVTDPVGQGFVESLARPGGNITGFTDYDPPMAGKWLWLLTQLIPPVVRAAIVFNPATAPFAGMMVRVIEESAPSLAMTVRTAPYRDDAEIEAMMTGLARRARWAADSAGKFQHCSSRRHYHPRRPVPSARGLSLPVFHRERRADVVRHRPERPVPARGFLCRSYPERRQAGRFSRPEPKQI